MDTKTLGNKGEDLACAYLVQKGFKILGKNYRITFGEIDIVAQRRQRFFVFGDKTIHFVEVKTLAKNNAGYFPEDHVDQRKQYKLRRLAELWLQKHGYKLSHPYQIDVVAVTIDAWGKSEIEYFPNAVSGV